MHDRMWVVLVLMHQARQVCEKEQADGAVEGLMLAGGEMELTVTFAAGPPCLLFLSSADQRRW